MADRSADPSETKSIFVSPGAAEKWRSGKARRDEIMQAATEMMLDLANLRAGSRVLDVAAGTGDQTLMAAQRVGSSGYVLATDTSSSMLNLAAAAARDAGLSTVGTRVADAESLDLDPNSFDAAICRLGLMLFSDPAKALRNIHGVLKRGGKFAAVVFSTAEKNPYQGIPLTVVSALGSLPPPMFALGDSGVLANLFLAAGFVDVAVHAVTARRRLPSTAEVIQRLKDASFLRGSLAKLQDTDRERAWVEIEQQFRRFETPNGFEAPCEYLVGVGSK
jgi:ubiquinone/menaquinone biosynthesis C-methylase UbiE